MISVSRFEVADEDGFRAQVAALLQILAGRPGFRSARAARSVDAPARWVLITEWDDVGSFRRALGNREVRSVATEVLGQAADEPTGYEELIEVAPGGVPALRTSDRA